MIVDGSSDVEYRVRLKSANKLHKCKGLLGKGLETLSIQIKMITRIQWIFHCLLERIGRIPFQHIFNGNSFRLFSDVGNILLFSLLHTAIVAYGIFGYKFEHPFGQGMIDQIVNILLTLFIIYL